VAELFQDKQLWPADRTERALARAVSAQMHSGFGGMRRDDGYGAAADAMEELAARQPGYLGFESARNPDGSGISLSYWDSLEAIREFKDVPAHSAFQARGRDTFYERYEVRVCSVERGYKFRI